MIAYEGTYLKKYNIILWQEFVQYAEKDHRWEETTPTVFVLHNLTRQENDDVNRTYNGLEKLMERGSRSVPVASKQTNT